MLTLDERVKDVREHFAPILAGPESIHDSNIASMARLVDELARELEISQKKVQYVAERNESLIRECHAIAADRDAERELRRELQMRGAS